MCVIQKVISQSNGMRAVNTVRKYWCNERNKLIYQCERMVNNELWEVWEMFSIWDIRELIACYDDKAGGRWAKNI